MDNDLYKYENELYNSGISFIGGVDEVGRGPLIGDVVAACVVLPRDFVLDGLTDSKKLSEKKRDAFYNYIINNCVAYGIGYVHADEIDKINIYEGDAVEILPTLNEQYDVTFIDAAKGKYPFFLKESLRMLKPNGVILADNILYKGYVMSDYNKHKQRTAVRNLREYIKEVTEDPNLETEILEVGDGLAVSRRKKID